MEGPAQRTAAHRPQAQDAGRFPGCLWWGTCLTVPCNSDAPATESTLNCPPRVFFPLLFCCESSKASSPEGPRSVLSAPRGLPLSHLCPSNTGITWSWCSHLIED